MQSTFSDFQALTTYIQKEEKGAILIVYQNCPDYEGMVLGIMLVFDTLKAQYRLDLQWMSFGLDPYGDTLQESYVYQFENLEILLDYLKEGYGIEVTDIPLKYKFDPSRYPDPINDGAKRLRFEQSWQKFQIDFRNGVFLDPSLDMVFSSVEGEPR